jgi:hypothetical protein
MRGLPDFNRAAFNEAAAKLRAAGHEVFNPAELDFTNDGAFAQELVWIIEHAEAIAFLPGWQDSRGARAEKATAEAIDRPIKLTNVDALLKTPCGCQFEVQS